jgi:putative transposase
MVRHPKPPSQTWRTFLANHMKDMVSSDFFVVPTVFFRVLFVFVILSHDRRRPEHMAVTEYPTAEWNAYVERLIGSIRRECLDHVIVQNETGLRRILKSYFDYYESSRTWADAPLERPIQPPWTGPIAAIPQVRGLHHRYERIAA